MYVLRGCGGVSKGDWCPKFRDNVVQPSSRVAHQVYTKGRTQINQPRGAEYKKNGDLKQNGKISLFREVPVFTNFKDATSYTQFS
jgi:hypothetical protein